MKRITYRPRAQRALHMMQRETAKRILTKIEAYAADPASQADNVKPCRGGTASGFGVGDYRVIMNDADEVLDILDVGHRREIY